MKTEQTKNTAKRTLSPTDQAFQITVTAILLIAGTWLVMKISKEMLKDLEGLGL